MHHPPDDAADGSTGAALHCEFSEPPSANIEAARRFGAWPQNDEETDYVNGSVQMARKYHTNTHNLISREVPERWLVTDALKMATEWVIPEEDPAARAQAMPTAT